MIQHMGRDSQSADQNSDLQARDKVAVYLVLLTQATSYSPNRLVAESVIGPREGVPVLCCYHC